MSKSHSLRRSKARVFLTNTAGTILTISMFSDDAQAAPAQDSAFTKPAESAPVPAARPPYGSDIFWGKVIYLLKLHDGYIMAAEFESEFDVHLAHQSSNSDHTTDAYLLAGIDWFTTAEYGEFHQRVVVEDYVVNPGGTQSQLSLQWKLGFDDPAQCIRADHARDDLIRLGWQIFRPAKKADGDVDRRSDPMWTVTNYFFLENPRSPESRIALFYAGSANLPPTENIDPKDGCVVSIRINGRPS